MVGYYLQEKQKKEAAASSGKGVKQSAGELRLQKGKSVAQPCWFSICLWHQTVLVLLFADISELNLAKGTTITFPEGKDKLLKFEITIRPEEGIYK